MPTTFEEAGTARADAMATTVLVVAIASVQVFTIAGVEMGLHFFLAFPMTFVAAPLGLPRTEFRTGSVMLLILKTGTEIANLCVPLLIAALVVGALVIGALVIGALVGGALVVGALVVGALVVGALVVGALVVGALVVGAASSFAEIKMTVLLSAQRPTRSSNSSNFIRNSL